jgi:hypothetical protein
MSLLAGQLSAWSIFVFSSASQHGMVYHLAEHNKCFVQGRCLLFHRHTLSCSMRTHFSFSAASPASSRQPATIDKLNDLKAKFFMFRATIPKIIAFVSRLTLYSLTDMAIPSQGFQPTVAGKLPISLHPHSVVLPSTATGTPSTVKVLWAVMILFTPCGLPPGYDCGQLT